MKHAQAYAAGFRDKFEKAEIDLSDIVKKGQAAGIAMPPALDMVMQQPVVREAVAQYLASKLGGAAKLAQMVSALRGGSGIPAGQNIL